MYTCDRKKSCEIRTWIAKVFPVVYTGERCTFFCTYLMIFESLQKVRLQRFKEKGQIVKEGWATELVQFTNSTASESNPSTVDITR